MPPAGECPTPPLRSSPMADLHTVDRVREAAARVDPKRFLELLRWHRTVAGLPDLEWGTHGSYRQGVAELDNARALELLGDLRRAARDPRRYRHGADGKPRYRTGTIELRFRRGTL